MENNTPAYLNFKMILYLIKLFLVECHESVSTLSFDDTIETGRERIIICGHVKRIHHYLVQ